MSSTQEVGEIFGAGTGPAHAMLRSPTVLIAAVGLWGMNVFFFRLFQIDYVKVLKHDLLLLEKQDRQKRYLPLHNNNNNSSDNHHQNQQQQQYQQHQHNQNQQQQQQQQQYNDGMSADHNHELYLTDSNDSDAGAAKGQSQALALAPPSSCNINSNVNANVSAGQPSAESSLQQQSHSHSQQQFSQLQRQNSSSSSPTMAATHSTRRKINKESTATSAFAEEDRVLLQNQNQFHLRNYSSTNNANSNMNSNTGDYSSDNDNNSNDNNSDNDGYSSTDEDSDTSDSPPPSGNLQPQWQLQQQQQQPPLDSSSISWERLVCLSLSLLFLLHFTYYVWIDFLGGGSIGAVFAFYGAVTAAIIFPIPNTRWLRKATVIVLQRAFELVNPRCSCVALSSEQQATGPRPIPFVDVFFADAMCSFSKVFFDWGMLFHMASHFPDPVPPSAHNILIPSACAAVPFVIRARQCLVMYTHCRLKRDPNKNDHLWNALKYSTSIFPLCLSAYQKTISAQAAASLDHYLIVLLAINAVYALYWDIVMDWGMMKNPTAAFAGKIYCMGSNTLLVPSSLTSSSSTMTAAGSATAALLGSAQSGPDFTGTGNNVAMAGGMPSCGQAILRPRLRFGVAMSALILCADVVLRFSWVLRFYHRMFPSGDSFVLCTQFLEVFRRAIWNLLRVEWENIKQMKNAKPPKALFASGSKEEDIGSTANGLLSAQQQQMLMNHRLTTNTGMQLQHIHRPTKAQAAYFTKQQQQPHIQYHHNPYAGTTKTVLSPPYH